MEGSEAGTEGDGMESMGAGDGGYGVDYEYDQSDKGYMRYSALIARLIDYDAETDTFELPPSANVVAAEAD
jgi:hypothetical protein